MVSVPKIRDYIRYLFLKKEQRIKVKRDSILLNLIRNKGSAYKNKNKSENKRKPHITR